MGEVEGMTLANRKKIDNIIKEYLLIDTRIKILKAKIRHSNYNNNNNNSAAIRYNDNISKLEHFRGIIINNVKVDYLEKLEIFKMDLDEAMELLDLSKSSITKLKAKIREEFAKVVKIIEAD